MPISFLRAPCQNPIITIKATTLTTQHQEALSPKPLGKQRQEAPCPDPDEALSPKPVKKHRQKTPCPDPDAVADLLALSLRGAQLPLRIPYDPHLPHAQYRGLNSYQHYFWWLLNIFLLYNTLKPYSDYYSRVRKT